MDKGLVGVHCLRGGEGWGRGEDGFAGAFATAGTNHGGGEGGRESEFAGPIHNLRRLLPLNKRLGNDETGAKGADRGFRRHGHGQSNSFLELTQGNLCCARFDGAHM